MYHLLEAVNLNKYLNSSELGGSALFCSGKGRSSAYMYLAPGFNSGF